MKNRPTHVKLLVADLERHPLNPNQMKPEYLAKLTAHIGRTNHYPPLIVRPHPADPGRYQIIDGHWRKTALQKLDHMHAWCQVWDVNDAETNILLATLNRLEGQDDPQRRGHLLDHLTRQFEMSQLTEQLPLDAAQIQKYIDCAQAPPKPNAPTPLANQVVGLTIFLSIEDKKRVVAKLRSIKDDPGIALLTALDLLPEDTPPYFAQHEPAPKDRTAEPSVASL